MTTAFACESFYNDCMAYKQPVSVLVLIHTSDLKVLLLERVDFPDAWQSVTGSREGEESLLETARREVIEETGFQAQNFPLLDWECASDYEIFDIWRHRYAPGVTTNTEHVFSLEVPESLVVKLSEREHRRCLWVNWDVAAEMVFSPSNAEAIRMLPERIYG